MAHGYYNLKGEWVATATREEATTAWRKERGYRTGGVYDMGGGDIVDTRKAKKKKTATAPAVPNIPEEYDVKSTQSLAKAPPTPDVPGNIPEGAGYDVQPIQSMGGRQAPEEPFYDVQSIQRLGAPTREVSGATPTEQAGGEVPERTLPYFADVGSGTKYLYSQWPYSAGATGTPTEQRYGQKDIQGEFAGYGPSSYQWSESPASLAEMAQGRTPVAPALAAVDTVEMLLEEFGVRPDFVTPFVAQSLGLSANDMMSMGYVQDLYGQWIALEFGEGEEGLAEGGGWGYGGGYGGGGYGGRYASPANFRSGYTSSLINWRVRF